METDDQLRHALEAFLTRGMNSRGIYVYSYSSESEARAALQRWANYLDCLIVNVKTPCGEGMELARDVRERFPRAKIIAMSGAFYQPVEVQAMEKLGIHALYKGDMPKALVAVLNTP
ncbi:MAG: response regulator [bacterium]|nr:response regulator [bacterium]